MRCSNDVAQGMENRDIADSKIKSSTSRNNYQNYKARLNYPDKSWCAKWDDEDPWIRVDLNKFQFISGLITQGSPNNYGWVTKYTVEFSVNEDTPSDYVPVRNISNDRMVFEANSDSSTPVTQLFYRPVRARYIKIWPVEWSKNGRTCMQFELLGCDVIAGK